MRFFSKNAVVAKQIALPWEWVRIILLALSLLLVYMTASAASFQQEKIIKEFRVKNATLEECIKVLGNKENLGFFYNIKEITTAPRITIDESNIPLGKLLDLIFANSGFEYLLKDGTIVVRKVSTQPNKTGQVSKAKIVKGIVRDESGEPIPGATLMLKGTIIGTSTSADGQFTLSVPGGNGILAVSFIGFSPMEVVLSSNDTYNITLKPEVKRIDEVVVTGYQKLSKERATGSYVTVNIKKLESKLQPSLSKLLEGQIPGLTTNGSGELEIRGRATLAANTKPLIVLDGFPYNGTLETINSNNIENITVLKDAVAASIYGSRSSNGVIVITTKSGNQSSFNLSYSGTYSVKMKYRYSDFLRSSTSDFIDGQIQWFLFSPSLSSFYYEDLVTRYMSEEYAANGDNTDYSSAYAKINQLRGIHAHNEIIDNVHIAERTHTHNIGISGSSNKNSYNVALKYINGSGDMINSNSDKVSLDVKNTWTPQKWFSLDIMTGMLYSNEKRPYANWTSLMEGSFVPYLSLFDAKGKPTSIYPFITQDTKSMIDSRSNMYSYEMNPIADLKNQSITNTGLQVRTGVNATFKIMNGLTVSAGGVWSRNNIISKTLHAKESFYVRNLVNSATDISNSSKKYLPYGDILEESRNTEDSWTLRTLVSFNRSFNDNKHIISVMGGIEVNKVSMDKGIFPSRVGYNSLAGTFVPFNVSDWNNKINTNNYIYQENLPQFTDGAFNIMDNRFVSYFGNGSYEFDNKYILSGSARLDLTNFFGTDPKYRYKPIWSIGGTWKLSNEEFFSNSIVDRLFIRGSYGFNGNISLTDGPFLILNSGSYSNDAQGPTSVIQSLPNNQLRWEKTASTNVGIDVSFFKRINLSVDFYNKLSTDLLALDAIDPTTGFQAIKKNAGSIRNRGIEVALNALALDKEVKWNTMVNFSYNNNKVLYYDVKRPYQESWNIGGPVDAQGYPGNALFGARFAGLNQYGETLAYTKAGEKVSIGSLTPEDLVYQGSINAPYTVSFTNQFSYNNFELSFMFLGQFGAKYRKDCFDGNDIKNRHFAERWKKPGDEAFAIYPAFTPMSGIESFYYPYIDILVGNASFVKLRDISITYTLPDNLKPFKVTSAKVYLQSRNLLTFKAKGVDIDPETSGLPLRPEFYVGLSINF